MKATDFKRISQKITDINKLDKVYNTILVPRFKRAAEDKQSKVRITDNMSSREVHELMLKLFDGNKTIQSLIETTMRPYLEDKGFKVITWSPAYSVEVAW